MPIGTYERTKEYRETMSKIMKGRKIFWKDKISKSLRGHVVSSETRKKLSDKFKIIAKEKGFGKWMKGKIYSRARNRKVSLGLKKAYKEGRKSSFHSEETRQKISEHRKGIAAWNKGVFGKKAHTWKGGLSFEPYSLDWTRTLKMSIRERDGYICQICYKKQKDITFHVHHIDYDKKNCKPANLTTLCNHCHVKTNFNRNYWKNYFREKRNTSYRQKKRNTAHNFC